MNQIDATLTQSRNVTDLNTESGLLMANPASVDSEGSVLTRNRSTNHVTFATYLKESIPSTPASLSSLSSTQHSDDHERTPLLRDDDTDLEEGDISSDSDPFSDSTTRLSCTPKGTFVTILVILAITGICVSAVYLGVGSERRASHTSDIAKPSILAVFLLRKHFQTGAMESSTTS